MCLLLIPADDGRGCCTWGARWGRQLGQLGQVGWVLCLLCKSWHKPKRDVAS